jgi:hypothetical protein
MSGLVKHLNTKHQPNGLTRVLRRPVEITTHSCHSATINHEKWNARIFKISHIASENELLGILNMNQVQMIDIVLTILTIAVIFGGYALRKLHQAVSAYSKSFGEESGKIDATTKKLEDIQNQLAQSVEITESIKKDIQQGAWRERELELLKREKLESYLMCFYTDKENLSHIMRDAFFDVKFEYDRQAGSKLSMLKILYLPELDKEHAAFLRVRSEFMSWIGIGQKLLVEQMRASKNTPLVPNEHMKNYEKLLDQLNECKVSIETKVKDIGHAINNA